jgi:DHA1 family multidrug resistance protein-like MFS transporter
MSTCEPDHSNWRCSYRALLGASFLSALGFALAIPLIPLLAAETIPDDPGRAAIWAAIALGIAPLMSAIAAPIWGSLGDRIGHKVMVLRALFAIGVLTAIMGAAGHPFQLIVLRILIGLSGAFAPAAMAALVSTVPQSEMSRSVGTLQASQMAGTVVGPLIGGVVADLIGPRWPFILASTLYMFGFVLVFARYRDRIPAKQATGASVNNRVGIPKTIWKLGGALFFVQFTDASFGPILPTYILMLGSSHDIVASATGITTSLGALGMALGCYWSSRLANSGRNGIILIGLLVAAAFCLPIAVATAWWQLPPARLFLGAACGVVITYSYNTAARLVNAERRGMVIGALASAGMAGWAVGSFLGGLLASIGLRAIPGVDLLLLAGVAISWKVLNRQAFAYLLQLWGFIVKRPRRIVKHLLTVYQSCEGAAR